MTHLVLIRPGASEYDEQHRLQGMLDLPLSERGRRDVELLSRRTRFLPLKAIYHGPGTALQDTASQLARARCVPSRRVDLLRNFDFGLWQGLRYEELRRRFPRHYRLWREDLATVTPPLGESLEKAWTRAQIAIRPLIKRHHDEMIALVVADPMIRVLAAVLRGDRHVPFTDPHPTDGFEILEARQPSHAARSVTLAR